MNMIDNNVKNASKETFWSILNEYTICVPRMQRNYAQGRKEIDVAQKRDNLLNDIFESLDKDISLDLNFIYGNDVNGIFTPIDGQQRLTTLFLLHWYFMVLSGKRTDDNIKMLLKFTYETRDVTRQFCQRLVKDVDLDLEKINENNLIKTIEDYYWYFNDFELDSSISSMLVVLQSIHDKVQLRGFEKCKKYFDLLISKECPLTFLFLNIDDVGLTDEIYIKMNARGKPLTEFENFKAQLTNYLASKDKKLADDILTKINCEWAQFFWAQQYKGKKVVFDDQIMNFFKFFMFNDYICNNNSPAATDRYKVRITLKVLKEETTFEFTNRLFKDEFRTVKFFVNEDSVVNQNTFRKLYKLLNTLCVQYAKSENLIFLNNKLYNKRYFDENSLFTRLVNTQNFGLPYEELVLIYAEYAFLAKYSNEDGTFDKNDELTNWIRYINNLSKSQLYNQQDDYYRSIRSINNMIQSDYACNILKYASSMSELVYRQGRGFGFFDLQAKEESIKALLLLKSNDWKSFIIEAENSYLDNQLSSIINFSGIEQEYDINMKEYQKSNPNALCVSNEQSLLKNITDPTLFVEYLIKIETFFDKNGLKIEFENNSIFRRALLTFGGNDSYLLIKEGQNYSFLNNTHRDYSFRRLLRDNNNGKRIFFKQLLDSIDDSQNSANIICQLEDLISYYSSHYETSWKYYFVTIPQILNSVEENGIADPNGEFVFKENGRFINMKSKDEILLCERQSTRSMNREFYSYVLFLKAKDRGLNVTYVKDFTETAEKYLSFKDKQNNQMSIIYAKDSIDNKYKYLVRKDGNIILREKDIEYILNYISTEVL